VLVLVTRGCVLLSGLDGRGTVQVVSEQLRMRLVIAHCGDSEWGLCLREGNTRPHQLKHVLNNGGGFLSGMVYVQYMQSLDQSYNKTNYHSLLIVSSIRDIVIGIHLGIPM
jgi:hypothetical protein